MAAFGRLWSEVAAELKLDPNNQVAQRWRRAKPGAASSFPGRWTTPANGCRSNCRACRCSTATAASAAIAASASAATSTASTNWRERAANARSASCRRRIGSATRAHSRDAARAARAGSQHVAEPAEAATAAPTPDRAPLSVAPAAANVVPFRPSPPAEPKTPPTLSPVERKAFRELAQELTARLRGPQQAPAAESDAEILPAEPSPAAEPTPRLRRRRRPSTSMCCSIASRSAF